MALTIKAAQQDSGQTELFGPETTIHDVVTQLGVQGTVNAGQVTALATSASLPKALAGRSGRQIADTASQALIREIEKSGLRVYSYSAWCPAGLPHRDLPPGEDWLIETDFARLLVRPGVRLRDDNSREALRVPMGSFARLLLIDWQTEALERGSREISMGRSATAVAARLGAGRGGPSNAIVDQLERLASCSVDFAFGSHRKETIVNQRLVEAWDYVAQPEAKARGTRMIERILLSQPFFDELRRHPVLVDRAAIRDLTSSPLAIDIYLWLAFRLHSLPKETPVSWDRLWRQFGSRVAKLKNFRHLKAAEQDREDLFQARLDWPKLQPTLDPRRLVFLDETWATINMTPSHGRAPKGQRLMCSVPHGHWHTTTFLCGLRTRGLVAPLVLDGADRRRRLPCLRPAVPRADPDVRRHGRAR